MRVRVRLRVRARVRVRVRVRLTLPSPSSVMRAYDLISAVLETCVPPQNSVEYCAHSALVGAAIIGPMPGPPTATTRTWAGDGVRVS